MGKVDEFILQIFMREVEHQCKFAILAFVDIRNALGRSNVDADRVFLSAHAFLVAVGNVSKLLWPTRTGDQARGEQLREKLGVSEASIIQSRRFRNYFEHFDESLDKWARSSEHKNFVDSNIASVGGSGTRDIMRNLDPDSLTLTFHGDSYELPRIAEELKPIQKAAEREVARFHRRFLPRQARRL